MKDNFFGAERPRHLKHKKSYHNQEKLDKAEKLELQVMDSL